MSTPPLPPARRPAIGAARQVFTAPPQQREAVTFAEPGSTGERIIIYGSPGTGKTSLAAGAPGPVVFVDLDQSVGSIVRSGGFNGVRVVPGMGSLSDIRGALQSPGWDDVRTLVLDSWTVLEDLATEHVLRTIKNDKGEVVTSLEGYGWGKGYKHLYDVCYSVIGDLQRHADAGRNVVVIAHDTRAEAPNPEGDDWLRFEPRAQHSNKVSLRERLLDWCDHCLFLNWDISVSKAGRGTGMGSRTIYAGPRATWLAKSRTLTRDSYPYDKGDNTIWKEITQHA